MFNSKLLVVVFTLLASACGQTLGTISNVQTGITCPRGTSVGAACQTATVTVPQLPDVTVTLAIYTPQNPIGTVVLHNGSTGTQPLNSGFVSLYKQAGYRVVQVIWTSWEAGGKGLLVAAARPATVFNYIYTNIHTGGTANAFCGQGSSAGTGAFGYALALFGQSTLFDAIAYQAGPAPFSRIDAGCKPSLLPNGVTFDSQQVPYTYTGAKDSMNQWEGTTTCGATNPSQADLNKWIADSITLNPNSIFTYPQTNLAGYLCMNSPNETVGLAALLGGTLTGLNGAMPYTFYSTDSTCTGELAWADPVAVGDTASWMEAACVPNHTTPQVKKVK